MKKDEDLFEHKSKSWDMNSKRVKNAQSIADLIVNNIKLDNSMRVMDFGAGTGLLSYFISSNIKEVIAVDSSPSMLEELKGKLDQFNAKVTIVQKDLAQESIDDKYDGIVSSMTIHHVEDLTALFSKFYNMLEDGGFIAIADLESEDGTFHSDNKGVYHFGFDTNMLERIASKVGFKNIKFKVASIIKKPHREFTVFVMLASR